MGDVRKARRNATPELIKKFTRKNNEVVRISSYRHCVSGSRQGLLKITVRVIMVVKKKKKEEKRKGVG